MRIDPKVVVGVPLALSLAALFSWGLSSAAIEGTDWLPIGPAPINGFFPGGATGRASALAVNPENPDDIWIGTAAGGVWHSVDGGENWKPMSDKEDSLAIVNM